MNARGCGTRKPGGLYLCCGTSPDGQPVEYFLVDPAVPLDVEPFRTPQLFEKNGLNHALVYIGEEFYSSVPKFVDETRMMGISRRIPANFPIDNLQDGSRMMMVHRRAVLVDSDKYKEVLETCKLRVVDWWCPKGRAEHRNPPEPPAMVEQCLGTLWPLANELFDVCAPYDYRTGVFASFPVTHIDYVKVPGQDGVPREIAERARKTNLQLNAVEE